MDNKQLLEQIKNIVRAETEPINKRLDSIDTRLDTQSNRLDQQGQKIDNIDTRLNSMDTRLNTFSQIQAQHTTLLEAIGEGQKEQATKKDIEEVKIEIQNQGAKFENRAKDQDRRIEDLEDHADIPHHN